MVIHVQDLFHVAMDFTVITKTYVNAQAIAIGALFQITVVML